MHEEAIYLTDDRDLLEEDQRSIVIFQGNIGDWYVQVAPKHGRTTEGVRLCTSGGASSSCPGLTVAIAEAYNAMSAAQRGERINSIPTRTAMEEEINAWRIAFPDHEYARGQIFKKG